MKNNIFKNNIKFLAKFAIWCIILFLILKSIGVWLVKPTTYQSYLILKSFLNLKYCGNYIYNYNISVEIIPVCTGFEFISIYIAMVFSLSRNFKELIIGIPLSILIYFGNLIRIVLIITLGTLLPKHIYFIHDIIGYLVIPTITVVTSMIYLKIRYAYCGAN